MNETGLGTAQLKYRVGKRVSPAAFCGTAFNLGFGLLVLLPYSIIELLKNGASFVAITCLVISLGALWIGSRPVIAWWRIRPHRKQWDAAANESPSGRGQRRLEAPTYSHELIGTSFQFPKLATPKTSSLISAACKTITASLVILIGFLSTLAVKLPFDPWLCLTLGVTFLAMLFVLPRLSAWEIALKPMAKIKVCSSPKPFQKDGLHQLHKQQLEAMGMVSLGLYQLPKGSWHESFLSSDGSIEVGLGFHKTRKMFNQHWLEIRSYLSNQTCLSHDAFELVKGNDELDKLNLLRDALHQHIENVSKLCRENKLKIATVTQFSLPHVWEYCETIEKFEIQEHFVKESGAIWQRLHWLPKLLQKPLFEFPTTTKWSGNAKPSS